MKKKKEMFSIGAVVLMLCVAFIPVVNGMHLYGKQGFMNEFGDMSKGYNFDLRATLTHEPVLLSDKPVELDVSNPPDGIKDGYFSIYNIQYEIYNDGPDDFDDTITVVVRSTIGDKLAFDSWDEYLKIEAKETVSLSHEVRVKTTDDSANREDEFDYEYIEIIVSDVGDSNYDNNFDREECTKFWRDGPEYVPTKSQVLASAPIKCVEIDGFPLIVLAPWKDILDEILEFLRNLNVDRLREVLEKFIDWLWKDVPEHLYNHRLGWVNNLTYYLTKMNLYVLIIILRFGQFCAAVADDIAVLAAWFTASAAFFGELATTGTFNSVLWQTMIDGANDVINAILNIVEAAIKWGGKIVQAAEALRDTYNEWLDWRNADPLFPWEEPITVEVKIDNIAKYQTPVTVTCRDKTEYIHDSKWHTFTVNSSPMYNEFGDRAPHKCVITVTAVGKESGETKTVSTLPVTSYCFSGGTVHTRIVMPDDKARSRNVYNDVQINSFSKIIEKVSNLPFFYFLEKMDFPSFFNNGICLKQPLSC